MKKKILFSLFSLAISGISGASIAYADDFTNTESINNYVALYSKDAMAKLEKYNNIFKRNVDWGYLSKNKLNGNSGVLWQTYDNPLSDKASSALKVFNYKKTYETSYKSSMPISISYLPAVPTSQENETFNRFFLNEATIFFAIKNTASDSDFETLNNNLMKDVKNKKTSLTDLDSMLEWGKRNKLDTVKFKQELQNFANANLALYMSRTFNDIGLYDTPLFVFGNKYFIPSRTIARLTETELVDLIDFLSLMTIMDNAGQIHTETTR